ncbi:MAG: ATP-binding protein [Thermocladium sp.]
MSGSDADLFGKFNEGEVSEALSRCANCGRFVLMGPPRSGKSFFIEKHLRSKLGAGVAIDEHTLGITTTKAEGEEAKGGLGLRERVMGYLKRLMPLIGKFGDRVGVDVEELRRILGDKAPRPIVEEAMGRIGVSPHMAYYIPWDSEEVRKCMEEPNACAFGVDVGKALKLIKEAFGDKRIKWFRVEYVPPGLVREVIDLIREKGEDGAREVLRGWVNAYFEASEALRRVLGLGEDLLEWEGSSVAFLSSFVNNIASYVIGGLAAIPISAAALALISALTYIAFKREGEGYLREVIDLRRSLEALRRPDGEFNELGELLVYWVAYAMGMSHDEAKRALMDITGLSMDELERRVNEIEGRIEELEEKFDLFRQEVPAGIVTADANEFAKGRIYPNIKVEGGELRIRVEDGYHSIVRAGEFNELVNGVRDKLLKHGFVVVVGPKGIGKSTLAAAVIWELFMNGDVGLVARVDRLDSENYNYQKFVTFVENYGEKFGRLLILYDSVSTEAYERGDIDVEAPMQTSIERTVNNLMKVVNSISPKASKPLTLIVLPSDIYNTLSEEVRNALEKYRLDVSQGLVNTEFLAELIGEYSRTRDKPSGCSLSIDVLSKLAGELAKFDSGHALIARLIGEELARNNCSVGEVERLINSAKGRAEAFIILHMNGLFKVHEDPDTAKALVEVFALRRPFVNEVGPGDPILTPGIVELIGEKRGARILYDAEGGELRGWLAHRQHDLIEDSIGGLLKCIENGGEECEELGDASKPWRLRTVRESLKKVSEMRDVGSAVKFFASNYGEKLIDALRDFSNCWRRAALIIGRALAGHDLVPRPEDLGEDVAKSLGDALRGCGVDDYLLVGNEIPPLILYLTYTRVLTKAFIDKYNEAVDEVNRVLSIARGRGSIYDSEGFYVLGLASIIAGAAGSGRAVEPGDADAALYIASFAIQRVASSNLIRPVLGALEPLRDRAPHRYLELLALAVLENLNSDTVRYIFNELNDILSNYGDVVKGHPQSLVHAIRAYADLLRMHPEYFDDEEVEGVVDKIVGLLNELGSIKSSLGVIAWAYALGPALNDKDVRGLMEEKLGINVFNKAKEVLGELNELREKVQELMSDKEFMSYVESRSIKAGEKAVKRVILGAASHLKHVLAIYRFDNDELKEAEGLFNEAAKEDREIDVYENYLIDRGLALRVEAIEGSLVGNKLVDGFRQLYEETFNEKHFRHTAQYLGIASSTLGEYLVSLALTGGDEGVKKIKELLEEHLWVLNADYKGSVLTRLMLNALLGPDRLDNELKGGLVVKPRELIEAFKYEIDSELLPALRVALEPEDVGGGCESGDSIKKGNCTDAVSAAKGDGAAVERLRGELIDGLRESLIEELGLFKGLGVNVDDLFNEFMELVVGLDGESLVQLLAPRTSMARLALMLYALINGDEKLAKAHALYGAAALSGKPLPRLFLDVYRACGKGCDLGNEDLRQAITKLFLYHV